MLPSLLANGLLVFCVQRLAEWLAKGRPNLTDGSLNTWLRWYLLKNPFLLLTSAKPYLGREHPWSKHTPFPDPLCEPEKHT